MYTQCPQCLTIFQIDEDALQASLGIVQCGRCAQRFDALRTLSNTLPPAPDTPLGDQDTAGRVPRLTEAVPPNAFEPHVRKRPSEAAAPPEAPVPELTAGDPGAQGFSVELPVTESGQPVPGSGSDWFTDFETELTTSLIADATRIARDEANGDNAWQVIDLPAQSLFSGPERPVVLADFRLYGEDLADQAAWCASLEDAGTLLAGAPDAATTPAYPPAGSEEAALPREQITPEPEESAMPSGNDEAREPDAFAAEPQALAPPLTGPSAAGEALPASMFLVHETADPDGAGAPDAEAAGLSEPVPSEEPAHGEVVSDSAEPLPPVYVRPRTPRTASVAWALGCLVLILLLAAQVAWIKRVELFRNPATHAWTARACQVVACHLPPIRDLAKLELVSRDVRPDPRVAGALTITATLRNDAHFRQPWPVVVVELTDLDGNPVAMRRFRPAEYMPDPARRAAGIAPGATSAIAFEVADPGKRAVSFQFSFE